MITLLSMLLLVHCSSDNGAPPAPTNLSIDVSQSTSVPGQVTVMATADNAKYYDIYFGETSGEPPLETSAGEGSYTYSSSGQFTITVEAHSSAEVFISDTKTITVSIPADQSSIPKTGYTTPLQYDGMKLVWQDEFNESTLNTKDWGFDIGNGENGWGNHELEYYTSTNQSLKDGCLVITAKKEDTNGQPYSSSRILTQGTQTFKYGRIDIRAALPKGQGIWPALWMLGSDINDVGWPACGEIDIMEMIGGMGRESTVHGTAHWQQAGQHDSKGEAYTLTSGSFQDEFHVYSITWNEDSIAFYVDDKPYNVVDTTPSELSEFRQPFFFIFNVAVGGDWPGNPDDTSTFPQSMYVDYVRVFQKQ